MIRSTRAGRALALGGVVALALTACSGGSDEPADGGTAAGDGGDALTIGTILPVTGSLAQLGPPEIAGVDLAIKEINDAGGLFGSDVEVLHRDSSDTSTQIAQTSAQELISAGVSAIVGAASSSVTLSIIDDITGAGIVQVSPANTATDLSGYSDFYFRTAPPDSVQGDVLGNLIIGDGASNVGILVFNDSYGTSLRDVVEGVVTDAGGTLVYGGSGQEFDPQETNFSGIVGDALATSPDAIAILAFTDQTPAIVRELVAQGWDMSKTYFVDGNLQNFGDDFPAGTLENAQGTLPGAFPAEDFQERLLGINPDLEDYSYAAESYDATLLVALAALKGGASDGATIQANMAAVSGADGGTECTGWEECSALVEDGEDIAYQAVSGVGPFNEANDPSSAFIGIYQFGPENTYTFTRSEEGEVPQS